MLDKPTPDPWDHWRRRVAGERVPIFENSPEWGYYRWQRKTDLPVAIFEHQGALLAIAGDIEKQNYIDPCEIWTWLKPISQEMYDATARDGKTFSAAALNSDVTVRQEISSDDRAWREAKTRIIKAAASGNGVRLTAQEVAEAAAEFGKAS